MLFSIYLYIREIFPLTRAPGDYYGQAITIYLISFTFDHPVGLKISTIQNVLTIIPGMLLNCFEPLFIYKYRFDAPISVSECI